MKPYTVMIQWPEWYMESIETYLTFVGAEDIEQAVWLAREECIHHLEHIADSFTHEDFPVVAVFEGHHEDIYPHGEE